MQKPITAVRIQPPPLDQRVSRQAGFAAEGEKKGRYHLPVKLESESPIGYRTRVSLSLDEAQKALDLLSLERPERFAPGPPPTEQQLFDATALGVLTARQSTNYRGHRQVTLGPQDSARAADLLRQLHGLDAEVLDHATHTHLCLSKPYRTPFTLLLTFVGHAPLASLLTVPLRAYQKRFQQGVDIPTIGYLQDLHVGIWADAVERAEVLASAGSQRANVLSAPFCAQDQPPALRELEDLAGLTRSQRSEGWRIAFVAQVGHAATPGFTPALSRKLGAAVVALRSERIQPGVNAEHKAPAQFHARQDMRVPDELVEVAGRAGYNAFHHWTGVERERAKELLILDRIDVLTDYGKERLRSVRRELEAVTDRVVASLPLWADLPTGKALSRNANRGRKAFALAGQRIYVGGLARAEVDAEGLDWRRAIRAVGAAASRGALVAEIAGCTDIPEGCDLLAGICLMAGPVNQNDIGKQFFGMEDLLGVRHAERDPTSLLLWTLKAKTVADPIGNEQQLLDAARKGALVDLRPGPAEVAALRVHGALQPLRPGNTERAFSELENFVVSGDGRGIEGNAGTVPAPLPAPWGAQ